MIAKPGGEPGKNGAVHRFWSSELATPTHEAGFAGP